MLSFGKLSFVQRPDDWNIIEALLTLLRGIFPCKELFSITVPSLIPQEAAGNARAVHFHQPEMARI
jgi:hypothetical protein